MSKSRFSLTNRCGGAKSSSFVADLIKTMKFLLCFVLLPLPGLAQQDFGENATWYYEFSETGYTGYKRVHHSGDTNMYGMTWLRFEISGLRQIRTGPGPNDLIQDTAATWPDIFLATRNDSVFRLTNQGPFLLYDFSANVGDSWQYALLDTAFGCTDTPIATVTAKGTEIIAGVNFDYFDISVPMDTLMINGQPSYQISASSFLNQRIYPKLGALNYNALFDIQPNLCDGSSFKIASLPSHNLRCYSDNTVSLNRSTTNQACDYWSLLSNKEIELLQLGIFPNPSHGTIQLNTALELSSISLLDLNGRTMRTYSLNETELELPSNQGLYLLRVTLKNGSQHFVKVQRM